MYFQSSERETEKERLLFLIAIKMYELLLPPLLLLTTCLFTYIFLLAIVLNIIDNTIVQRRRKMGRVSEGNFFFI